jgi:hypothetical protein
MRLRTFFSLLLFLAVGCNEVEERLSWSPDGSRAILRVDDKLHFVDTNGNLSSVIASNVTAAAWLPDSRGVVLVRSLNEDKWEEAESLLPPAEVNAAQALAKSFLALGVEGTEQFEPKRPELASAAILYLFDTQSNALYEALQKSKDPAKLEADLSNARTTQVAEVSVVALDGKPLRVIGRTLASLQQPRPSPTTPEVAFLREEMLTVAPLDGGTNRVSVAERVEGNYDWTPDGKSLAYAVRLSEKDSSDINLFRIERRTVINPSGALVAGDTLPLALGNSGFAPRAQCLPDGRVLFAAFQQQLPAPAFAARETRFFLVDPSQGSNAVPAAIPTPHGALPQDLAAFAPSPDGGEIAIVESGSDVVAVLDVATGGLEVISPKRGWKSKVLPAWRDANELYFAALPESSTNRPELFRWRIGSAPVAISTNWPDSVVNTLLEKPSQK